MRLPVPVLCAVTLSLLLSACRQANSALVLVSHDRELERHFERSLALEADR